MWAYAQDLEVYRDPSGDAPVCPCGANASLMPGEPTSESCLCTNCSRFFRDDEDLEFTKDEKGYGRVCPACGTDDYLMDKLVAPTFVETLAERLRTQDNLCTSDPVFCVFDANDQTLPYLEDLDEDEKPLNDPHGTRVRHAVFTCDYDAEITNQSEIDGYLAALDVSDQKFKYIADDGVSDEGDVDSYVRGSVLSVPRFRVACLTAQAAEDYMTSNRHNLHRPFIYVESGCRNDEWIALRQHFLKKG